MKNCWNVTRTCSQVKRKMVTHIEIYLSKLPVKTVDIQELHYRILIVAHIMSAQETA